MERGVGPALPDGFDTVRVLGHGATGIVVLARQRSLDRLVAVKLLHTGTYDDAAQARLEREGRALVSLRHRHIVAAYQLLATDSGHALVLEYVECGDLRSARHPPPPLVALDQLAQALEHAHARGIVHRDVKPANALVSATGEVKLADFGLARLASRSGFRTAAGAVAGTPAYLAPEQIRSPEIEHPASDTYALAVLAYQLLVGRHPFAGRTAHDLVQAHLAAEPPAPRIVVPGVGRAAEAALLAGLAKDPDARPRPVEMVAALRDGRWDPDVVDRPLRLPRPARVPDATATATSAARLDARVEVPRPAPAPRPDPVVGRPRRTRRRLHGLALAGVALVGGTVLGFTIVTVLLR